MFTKKTIRSMYVRGGEGVMNITLNEKHYGPMNTKFLNRPIASKLLS